MCRSRGSRLFSHMRKVRSSRVDASSTSCRCSTQQEQPSQSIKLHQGKRSEGVNRDVCADNIKMRSQS